jgi:hypothetical protein
MDSDEESLPFARLFNQRLPPIMCAGHICGPVTSATSQLRRHSLLRASSAQEVLSNIF